jgi:hypothetical protein
MSVEFDWNEARKESFVIPEQPETVVYTNPNGDLVIRQRDTLGTTAILMSSSPERMSNGWCAPCAKRWGLKFRPLLLFRYSPRRRPVPKDNAVTANASVTA